MKLIKYSQETLDNGVKIIILVDAETNGAVYAQAILTLPKEKKQ